MTVTAEDVDLDVDIDKPLACSSRDCHSPATWAGAARHPGHTYTLLLCDACRHRKRHAFLCRDHPAEVTITWRPL